MIKSEQINELATALSAAQGEMKHAPTLNENPFYKSKYADLATVIDTAKPILEKHGLSVSQMVGGDNGEIAVTTILIHASGQFLGDTVSFHPDKPDIQKAGAIVTYLRRYSYSAICGMASEEDTDGNDIKGAEKIEKKAPPVEYKQKPPSQNRKTLEERKLDALKYLAENAKHLGMGKEDLFKSKIDACKDHDDFSVLAIEMKTAVEHDSQEALF